MKCKVIQCATGMVGSGALRAILGRPDLELVGVFVTSDSKAGRDAGDLCGAAKTGIVATSKFDEILAMDADCVSYSATDVGPGRPEAVVDNIVALLGSGKNVVTVIPTQLFHPATADQEVVARLETACEAGNSTLHFTGIFPGWLNDALIFSLTNLSDRIQSIRMAEMLEIPHCDANMLRGLGCGSTREKDRDFPAEFLNYYWESSLHFLAEAFDLKLDQVEHFREVKYSETSFETSSGLYVGGGTVAAVHWGLRGTVDGHPRLIIEHYERLHRDMAPDWPQPPGLGGYRFHINGTPGMKVDLELTGIDPLSEACEIAGNRVANVIADVCRAKTGFIKSISELPFGPGAVMVGGAIKH